MSTSAAETALREGDAKGALEALDKAWAETAVTFGPSDSDCPKASALVEAMNIEPPRASRRAGAAA